MIFVETKIFTDDLQKYLTDMEYSEFQKYLADNPTGGDIIINSGGLRKVRWKANGKSKSGGVGYCLYI
tara:strand:+ start:147 stop:350 length:204 start_codon:yes stop_codon:yes gene_type:complete